MLEALIFFLPTASVGVISLLWWQLTRPNVPLPLIGYRPVESAEDVDPERIAWIRRRTEAQLQVTRERCFAHDYDERRVCRRCKAIQPIMITANRIDAGTIIANRIEFGAIVATTTVDPNTDRHVAFPEPEIDRRVIDSIPQGWPLTAAEWCEHAGHLMSWGSTRCVRCGKVAD